MSNIVGRYVRKRDSKLAKKNGFTDHNNPLSNILKNDGLVFFDGLIGHHIVDELASEWGLYCKNHEMPSDYRLQLSSEGSIKEFNCSFRALRELFTEDIQSIIEQYYNSYLNLLNIHIYRITTPSEEYMNTAYGETGNWHTDGSSSESLKVFVLLSDVSEKDGPMHLMNLSQTRDIVKGGYFTFASEKSNIFIEENYKAIKFTGKKGKVMITRTNDCLHRASIPRDGRTRDILTFYLTTSGIKREKDELFEAAVFEQFYGPKRVFLR